MGWVCAWDGQVDKPESCEACYDQEVQDQCGLCFAQTHIYAFYLDLVTTAGHVPACVQHPAAELCAMILQNSTDHVGSQAGMLNGATPANLEPSMMGANATNSTNTQLGSFGAAAGEVRARLAQADAAVGPGGLVLGGVIIGVALACCRNMCCTNSKQRQQGGGWQPVTLNAE